MARVAKLFAGIAHLDEAVRVVVEQRRGAGERGGAVVDAAAVGVVGVVAGFGAGGGVEPVGGALVAVARAAERADLARAVADGVVAVLVEDVPLRSVAFCQPVELVVEVEAALGGVEVIDHLVEVRPGSFGPGVPRGVVVHVAAIEDRGGPAHDVDAR